ncbi:unnamed protein product [Phytophthora fragariaefolia]|uniref:Unnamed protein product n=1 Tax=Phytophthora fragariaefolia TaxID=1490495 RepID=A0A9W6YQA9_9STRA|nr:unnamed protein product [Phytophthora fragariaefolia]
MTLSAESGIGATVESEVMTEVATTLGTEAETPAEIDVLVMSPAELAAGVVDTATDRDATSTAEPAGVETEAWTGEADPGAVAAEFEIAEPAVNSHGDEPPTTAGSKVGAAETTVVTAVLKLLPPDPKLL